MSIIGPWEQTKGALLILRQSDPSHHPPLTAQLCQQSHRTVPDKSRLACCHFDHLEVVPFLNQAVPGSSLLSGGPGPVPPWSENDQTQAGENPKSDNLRPETGAVAWSIRGAGSSRQVEVAWQAPSSLPYTAPPPLHHPVMEDESKKASQPLRILSADRHRPSCQTSCS